MRLLHRSFAVVLLAVGAALPVARSANAATAAPVLLRYRFVPGEILTYQLVGTDTERMIVSGKTVDQGTVTEAYQAHVFVRSVDPAGDALLSITNDHVHVVTVHNGVVKRSTPAGDTLTTPTDACYQEVSGTQYCSYRGAFGQNDIGQVAAGPVAVGATWTSRIDNTWDVARPTPVYLRNVLRSVSQGPSGRIATLVTTAPVRGTTGVGQGDTITGTLVGQIDGTWRFAIDTGVFSSENLRQTYDVSGITRTAHGTQPATGHGVTITTMRLLSVHPGRPKPFRKPGPVKTYSNAALGFRVTYPAGWTGRTTPNGSFAATTSDGNAALMVARSPGANPALATDAAFLQGFVRQFGEPVDPVIVSKATMRGHVAGIADTVLASSDTTELQCEVRVIAARHGLYYLVSLVALGRPEWAQRLQHAAWRIEEMRRALDSMTVL